jgi:NTE family protein
MADFRVDKVVSPSVSLAAAVAASSAFPPVLSPATLDLTGMNVEKSEYADSHEAPYTEKAILTDGGVYDNLGLETVWKNYRTVLASNAGGAAEAEPNPGSNWLSHTKRIVDIQGRQVRSLRIRQLVGSYVRKTRLGAYRGIRVNIAVRSQ